jgi:hypothetical protein
MTGDDLIPVIRELLASLPFARTFSKLRDLAPRRPPVGKLARRGHVADVAPPCKWKGFYMNNFAPWSR